MSDHPSSFTGVFGLAQPKCEGSSIGFDPAAPLDGGDIEETFWFERAFTKAEYAVLARALVGDAPLVAELRDEMGRRAISGYDRL